MTNVITIVSKFVSFVRSKRTNRRQFKDFLSNMESEYGDAFHRTEVYCLSRGWVLILVYDLKLEIELFMEMRGKLSPQLCDHDWMCDFAFCIDITEHMKDLDINLQGANTLSIKCLKKQLRSRGSFDCGNCSCGQTV